MGRTLLPFRMALEREIDSWKEFYRALRNEDRIHFTKIMDNARAHADSGAQSARPLLSEVIFMAQFIELQKTIDDLYRRISTLEELLHNMMNERSGGIWKSEDKNAEKRNEIEDGKF